MTNTTGTPSEAASAIPADDPARRLTVADPEDPALRHVSVAGRTAPPPALSAEEKAERGRKAHALAAQYRTEFVTR